MLLVRSLVFEGGLPGRPTEGVVDAHGPSHALLTLNRREYLGGILEGDRAFSQRVTYSEKIHEENHRTDL
jgi:hypothetical protein